MHEQASPPAQREERVESEVLQAAAVVGMKMGHGHGGNAVEIERNPGCGRSLDEHFPHRVGAVDEHPVVIGPQRQAGGVMMSCERLADAQGDQS